MLRTHKPIHQPTRKPTQNQILKQGPKQTPKQTFTHLIASTVMLASLIGASNFAKAEDVIEEKTIGMELARDLATEAIKACRENGYSVSAVVVDRHGNQRVALRDDYASRFTLQIAEEKANSTIMSGLKSGQFRAQRGDIRPELNHVKGVLMMVGAVPIIKSGIRIGAMGVSGAPGGEKDEACAQVALEKLEERLLF